MRNLCPHRFAIAPVKIAFAVILSFLMAVTFPGNLKAQTTISGDIVGIVSDQSGAAIPGAKVTITNTDTGTASVDTTSATGGFRAALLKPGNYTVSVSAPNFQTTETKTTVAVGQTSTVNLALAVARGSQTVEVLGTAVPLLQPENSDLATTISIQQVQNLPNPGGDITYYINLTQGVVMNTQGGYGNSSAFGLPATSNNFTVNGAQDNDPFLNLNNSGPSNLLLGSNDVDEVNIVANAYSAQYGGLGGVQENIITRSGSNKFHGNATYWWTNSDLNANNWFNDNTNTVQPFANANQWAAAVGGPIVKDKAFFFVNYESLRFVTSVPNLVLLPSPAYQTAVLNNLSAMGAPYSNMTPFYQKAFALYNSAPGASSAAEFNGQPWTNFFYANSKNNLAENLVNARYDQKIGPNDSAFIHFKWDHGVQPTYVDPINPVFSAESDQPDYEGQIEETHTFSPNLVNQFLIAGAWYSALFTSVNQAQATATFPYSLAFSQDDGSFYDLDYEGYLWPQGRNVTQYQFNDDLSWTKSKHSMSFGFIFKRNDVTDHGLGVLNTALGVEAGPNSGAPTVNPDGSLTVSPDDPFANGSIIEGIQNFPLRPSAPIAVYSMGFYAQDQWKLAPNFQFTYGLRLEHNSNPVCQVNCFAHFSNSYSNVTAGLDTPYNQVLLSGLHTTFDNLQKITVNPRIGFTFSPPNRSNTVFRGGFGLFTDAFPATVADSLLSNAPLNPQFAGFGLVDPSQSGSFTNSLSNANQAFVTGYANGGTFNTISAANPNFTQPNVTNADGHIHYPTYEEWSLQWQQQIGKSMAFQIGYVGNHGYHEPVTNNGVNASQATSAVPFGGLPATPALPAFAGVTEIQSVASSNYNGLIATVKYQSKILSGSVNYSWSHALDMISNGGFLPFGQNAYFPINPFNLAQQNYGNADYDVRHNLNGNYLITVPHFGGPALLTDGWQIGGTLFWHAGFPFSVTDSSVGEALNATGNYGGTLLAAIADPTVPHHCGKSAIANGCFGGDPATNTPSPFFADPTSFGGQRRNQFFGPGYFNTDLSLFKNFKLPKLEGSNFQIGAQAYNVLNHPDFANPIFNYSNTGSFGYVQNTVSVPTSVFGSFLGGDASPRILQLKAKFTF